MFKVGEDEVGYIQDVKRVGLQDDILAILESVRRLIKNIIFKKGKDKVFFMLDDSFGSRDGLKEKVVFGNGFFVRNRLGNVKEAKNYFVYGDSLKTVG